MCESLKYYFMVLKESRLSPTQKWTLHRGQDSFNNGSFFSLYSTHSCETVTSVELGT
jgi:hypothetical protein